jgi:hypothetical protein
MKEFVNPHFHLIAFFYGFGFALADSPAALQGENEVRQST